MKSIFEFIANLISGENKTPDNSNVKEVQSNEKQSPQENASICNEKEAEVKTVTTEKNNADIKGNNSIEIEANIKAQICQTLNQYYKGKNVNFENKILTIYILDNILFDSINNSEFKEDLRLYMDNELGYNFNSLDIKSGRPSQGETYTEITPNIFIKIKNVGNLSNSRKAMLVAIPGFGSTVEEKYILDSEELTKGNKKFYNIGVGKYPKMDNASFRENHIAIDDNPNSPQFENNRYVSRAHAHIGYTEENGFMLYAEIGGTPSSGKRTEISRDGEIIRITSTMSPEALADGDCIVLSRKVKLIFKTI